MTSHPTDERLNDFVDEVLSEVEASPLRRHLEGCMECRAEILALRRLRSEALALPRGITPGRDLWAGIRSGIEADRFARPLELPLRNTQPEVHPLRQYWRSLVSAAAALVVLTTSVTMVLLRPTAPEGQSEVLLPRVSLPMASGAVQTTGLQGGASMPGGGVTRLQAATESYERAAADLLAAFTERKSQLRPTTVATVEQNLRVVDEALRRAHAALAADPANPDLNSAMTSTWQRKVDLLDKAVRLTSDL